MTALNISALRDSEVKIGDLKRFSEAALLPENRNIHYDPQNEILLDIENKSAEEILQELEE